MSANNYNRSRQNATPQTHCQQVSNALAASWHTIKLAPFISLTPTGLHTHIHLLMIVATSSDFVKTGGAQ